MPTALFPLKKALRIFFIMLTPRTFFVNIGREMKRLLFVLILRRLLCGFFRFDIFNNHRNGEE